MARVKRDSQVVRTLAAAGMTDIDLPHAGERFVDFTAEDVIERLLMLREVGYHVPQSALDELRAEVTTADA